MLTRYVGSPAERISEMLGNLQHKCRREKVGMNPAKGSLTIPMGLKKGGFMVLLNKVQWNSFPWIMDGFPSTADFLELLQCTSNGSLQKWSFRQTGQPTERIEGPLRMEQVNLHGTLILRNSSTCSRQIVDKRSRGLAFHDVFSKVRININSKCLQATPRYCKKYLDIIMCVYKYIYI